MAIRRLSLGWQTQRLAALVTAAVPTPAASVAPAEVAKPRPPQTRVEEGGWLKNRWQPLDD